LLCSYLDTLGLQPEAKATLLDHAKTCVKPGVDFFENVFGQQDQVLIARTTTPRSHLQP
jgi:hypothetical protein